MFVSFSRTLKNMSGVRFGAGFRVTKGNAWWVLLAILMVTMVRTTWYLFILIGWLAYYMLYGFYLLYYYLFKYCIIGFKKVWSLLKNRR